MADVTLLDGRVVDSYSPDWKAECLSRETEARTILRMPDIETRRSAIRSYGALHGEEAQRRLEGNIRLLWSLRTGAPGAHNGTA
jgi:hypothetical protein